MWQVQSRLAFEDGGMRYFDWFKSFLKRFRTHNLKTNDGSLYRIPEKEMERMVKEAREWKRECLLMVAGKWSSNLEAYNFPFFIRDYARQNLKKYLVKEMVA